MPGTTSWSAPPAAGAQPAAAFPLPCVSQDAAGCATPGERPARPEWPGEESHQRFKTQRSGTPTPRRPARSRGSGPRHARRLQRRGPFGSRPGRCPAGDTGAPRRPQTLSDFARHLSRPRRQDLRSPRSGVPRPVPAPMDPAPAAVSARATAAAAAHFRFPRTARAAAAARESPQAAAPPRSDPPRERPASAVRTRGLPGLGGPRRRPRVGRETDAA